MNDAHLEDDALSALIDGHGSTDDAAHVDVCPTCRRQMARFESVSRSLRLATGPTAAEEDRAIRAALEAWSATTPVTSLAEVRSRRGRRWLLPAAAAVAAVLVGGGVLVATGDGDNDEPTTFAAGTADGPVPSGGDLGEQNDATALGQLVSADLAPPTAQSAAADSAVGGAAAPTTTARRAGAQAETSGSRRQTVVNPPCARTVRADFGKGLGSLVYTATLQWQGTPAVLLAYAVGNGERATLNHRVFVMARSGCRLLVVQSL